MKITHLFPLLPLVFAVSCNTATVASPYPSVEPTNTLGSGETALIDTQTAEIPTLELTSTINPEDVPFTANVTLSTDKIFAPDPANPSCVPDPTEVEFVISVSDPKIYTWIGLTLTLSNEDGTPLVIENGYSIPGMGFEINQEVDGLFRQKVTVSYVLDRYKQFPIPKDFRLVYYLNYQPPNRPQKTYAFKYSDPSFPVLRLLSCR